MGDSENKSVEMGNLWVIEEVPVQIETETQTSPQHYCSAIQTETNLTNPELKDENSTQFNKNFHEIQPLVPKKTDFNVPCGPSKNRSTSKENLTGDDILLEFETIGSAYLAFFFSCFNFLWSISVAYWHLRQGCIQEGIFTAMITFFGGVAVVVVYLSNKNILLKSIWKGSKILYLLNLVPCLTPIMMSAANTVFALKEGRCKTFHRPWYKTRIIFLTEALAFSFLQCLFQTCILMEDGDSIPSLKGFFIYFGIFISTFGITYARVRYDSGQKFERFGKGIEKCMRVAMIWSYKVLWILTICCILVVLRIRFPEHQTSVTVLGFIGMQIFFELQVMLSTTRFLSKFFETSVGLFFIIPQFCWIISLIVWVNVDTTIYETYIGSIILGSFFYAEFICLAGWLSDSCRDKETDYVSFYPHFFGNILGNLYKHNVMDTRSKSVLVA